ncbi:hypothetical protein BDY21DRAFT_279514, partial [Lineolata rhizophorae]
MVGGTRLIVAAGAIAALSPLAHGHMVMHSPVPYGVDSLNNSPLAGGDFPCKQRPGVYEISTMNDMAVGEEQELSFMGGATHGGGSCQVSVTLDQEPTPESTWKVVHSIIGGCPTADSGNAGDDPNAIVGNPFRFSLPEGMPNGQYTLAWTWFNKIGNREMYMNCAPITVTGGADEGDTSVFDSLPDMFVANIPEIGCGTQESQDAVFPDPG